MINCCALCLSRFSDLWKWNTISNVVANRDHKNPNIVGGGACT